MIYFFRFYIFRKEKIRRAEKNYPGEKDLACDYRGGRAALGEKERLPKRTLTGFNFSLEFSSAYTRQYSR